MNRRNALIRLGCGGWIWSLLLGGFFLALFAKDILLVRDEFKAFRIAFEQQPADALPLLDPWLRPTLFMLGSALVYLVVVVVVSRVVSGAVLPLPAGGQPWSLTWHFLGTLLGLQVPVLHVREGEISPPLVRGENGSGGIALVDACSALVLEEITHKPQQAPRLRVCGPGVIFIRPKEEVRGTVSLRNQRRIAQKVLAYTSDGIEVQSDVRVVFSISQPPPVIKVAYAGEPRFTNLRVLKVDATSGKILELSDELEEIDKRSIHEYAQQFLTFIDASAPLEDEDRMVDVPPFPLDEERVIAAVCFSGRNSADGESVPWGDLPLQVAVELFRRLMAQWRYDDLYLSPTADVFTFPEEAPGTFPLLQEVKPEFRRRMIYQGVVSYQFVYHRNGRPIVPGLRLDRRAFRISPVQPLPVVPGAGMLLRERGICVLEAAFAEVTPTDEKVLMRRLETWRTRWQHEVEAYTQNISDEVKRIREEARAAKLNNLVRVLLGHLHQQDYADEPLMRQLGQTLEDVLEALSTRGMTSEGTTQLVQTLEGHLKALREASLDQSRRTRL